MRVAKFSAAKLRVRSSVHLCAEKPFDMYTGNVVVDKTGAIDPNATVGFGYGDRYITTVGPQGVTLPDERTARWLVLTFHCYAALGCPGGVVNVTSVSFIQTGKRGLLRGSMYALVAVAMVATGRHSVLLLFAFPCNAGVGINAPVVGSFECDDAEVNAAVALSLTHAIVSMSDSLVDCPSREDGGWIEDAVPRSVCYTARGLVSRCAVACGQDFSARCPTHAVNDCVCAP